jgi:hypothetical protein
MRLNRGGTKVIMTTLERVLADIHGECLCCMGMDHKEVEECTMKSCKLYRYRLGRIEDDIEEPVVTKKRKGKKNAQDSL